MLHVYVQLYKHVSVTIALERTKREGMLLKFLKTRDLRQKTAEVLQNIKDEEYVITSNGKPVALLSAVDDDLELQLQAIRRARAELSVYNMQKRAIDNQLDRLTEEEITAEIEAARQDR